MGRSSGTFSKGNSKAAKLNAEMVLEIREKYATGDYTQGRLAREYQVSGGTIFNIVNGMTWQNVPMVETEQQVHYRLAADRVARAQAQPQGGTVAQGQTDLYEAAQASARKVMAMLAAEPEVRPGEAAIQKMLQAAQQLKDDEARTRDQLAELEGGGK